MAVAPGFGIYGSKVDIQFALEIILDYIVHDKYIESPSYS